MICPQRGRGVVFHVRTGKSDMELFIPAQASAMYKMSCKNSRCRMPNMSEKEIKGRIIVLYRRTDEAVHL